MSENRGGLTFVEVLVVIVIVGILAALLIPHMFRRGRYDRRITICANNLSQLWKMENIYRSKFGGRLKLMYPGTGKDFWLHMMSTQPPLIESSLIDVYYCPAQESKAEGTHYLGPKSDVNDLKDEDVVGCDVSEHETSGGGNVLRKSGDVCVYWDEFKELQSKCCE